MSASEIEVRAKQMGWLPKEEFKGPEEKWVDADAYVERGEQILPILRANNKRLSEQVTALENEQKSNRELLKAATESIEELKKFNSEINKDRVKNQKAELVSRIREARESGDVELETTLTDQLGDTVAALKAADAKPAPREQPKPAEVPELTAAGKAWLAENQDWFGKDRKKTGFAHGVAAELMEEGKVKPGSAEFYEELGRQVNAQFGTGRTRGSAKVGSPNASDGTRVGSGKTFADLPADAKSACKRQGQRLVGPGRAFKDEASWQAHYVSKYFEE